MKIRKTICFSIALCTMSVFAQEDARMAYQQRQAIQEVQRLSSQFDQLQNGMESLSSRIIKLENSNSSGDLRAEVGALRSELNALKRRQESMKGEIIAEISKKMADLIAKSRPATSYSTSTQSGKEKKKSRNRQSDNANAGGPTGPYFEHTVEAGETLSYIAKECKTTIRKIKQFNNMKNDALRVGQIIKIPAEGEN